MPRRQPERLGVMPWQIRLNLHRSNYVSCSLSLGHYRSAHAGCRYASTIQHAPVVRRDHDIAGFFFHDTCHPVRHSGSNGNDLAAFVEWHNTATGLRSIEIVIGYL
jgi:hypothetical protein